MLHNLDRVRLCLYQVRHIATKEGARGLYAGYGAFMLRDLPFDAVEFFTYETLKTMYKRRVERELRAVESAGIGAVAGGFTGVHGCNDVKCSVLYRGELNLIKITITIYSSEFGRFISSSTMKALCLKDKSC